MSKSKFIIVGGAALAFVLPYVYFARLAMKSSSFKEKQFEYEVTEERKESSLLLSHYEEIVGEVKK
eukprot:CAMPEP_0168341568 /NCGR_PEP_ID=MMETSP0213-20121227/14780_1 /TAXON_ID=151035 /ORGANISM="Euplotes harpa, Strain FSP1.4" /LENGTH=65 /DNA_ID=CAMNT_0008348107 /DNA_START=144 /DNA_END=341 /DNA_ORIENTATION=+